MDDTPYTPSYIYLRQRAVISLLAGIAVSVIIAAFVFFGRMAPQDATWLLTGTVVLVCAGSVAIVTLISLLSLGVGGPKLPPPSEFVDPLHKVVVWALFGRRPTLALTVLLSPIAVGGLLIFGSY